MNQINDRGYLKLIHAFRQYAHIQEIGQVYSQSKSSKSCSLDSGRNADFGICMQQLLEVE